jgi:hypothetical protein
MCQSLSIIVRNYMYFFRSIARFFLLVLLLLFLFTFCASRTVLISLYLHVICSCSAARIVLIGFITCVFIYLSCIQNCPEYFVITCALFTFCASRTVLISLYLHVICSCSAARIVLIGFITCVFIYLSCIQNCPEYFVITCALFL